MNTLYYGDNLDILREYIKDKSVDLIYLDPPWKKQRDYNVLFREATGTESPAQIKAFEDTWHWDQGVEDSFREIVEGAPSEVAGMLAALVSFLGRNDVTAYLVMIAPRLLEMKRTLKDGGTIYFHCDPTMSHYIKLVMDTVFGKRAFRNEIIWGYSGGGIPQKDFPHKHDVIFRYSKGEPSIYNPIYKAFTSGTRQRGRTKVKGKYAELRPEGTPIPDWWYSNLECPYCEKPLPDNIKRIVSPTDPERLSYPTQKSIDLLSRIIKTSSNQGDVVLDPFCGCGTTIVAAEILGRKWIGIDITHLAVSLMEYRLQDTFGDQVDYEVIGRPVDVEGAKDLARRDRLEFQRWAVSLVKAKPIAGDGGKDGIINFFVNKEPEKIIVQVKSGSVNPGQIRDLIGTVKAENAAMGFFITLEEPTTGMRTTAAAEGYYEWGLTSRCPKIQIRTIQQLFEGEKFEQPPSNVTFKEAKRYYKKKGEELELL